jgi:hypothetical protein
LKIKIEKSPSYPFSFGKTDWLLNFEKKKKIKFLSLLLIEFY